MAGPRPHFTVVPPRELSLPALHQFVGHLNRQLTLLGEHVARATGTDGYHVTFQNAVDLNQQRLMNAAPTVDDQDVPSRAELREFAMYARDGEFHEANRPILARQGILSSPTPGGEPETVATTTFVERFTQSMIGESLPFTAAGDLLSYDGTNPVAIAAGTLGFALVSNGPGTLPTWQAVAGTGTVTSVGQGDGITATPNPVIGVGTIAVDGTVVRTSRLISTSTGLSGGGDLSANRTILLADTAVTPAAYGDATHVGTFTVDQQGRLTAASSVVITGTPPGGAAGGDLTGTYPSPTLAAIITAGGPTGSATVTPIITYDAKGRLTAVSSATITPAASSITGGAALSRTNDTNVTLTLGGAPTTALLTAASMTLGWAGTLALARGGTAADLSATGGAANYLKQAGVGSAITVGTIPYTDVTGTPSSLPPSGAASGDLSGTYPGPTVSAINGIAYNADPLVQYTKLAGRTGTTNDTTLSTSADGSLYGSSVGNTGSLHLYPNSTTPPTNTTWSARGWTYGERFAALGNQSSYTSTSQAIYGYVTSATQAGSGAVTLHLKGGATYAGFFDAITLSMEGIPGTQDAPFGFVTKKVLNYANTTALGAAVNVTSNYGGFSHEDFVTATTGIVTFAQTAAIFRDWATYFVSGTGTTAGVLTSYSAMPSLNAGVTFDEYDAYIAFAPQGFGVVGQWNPFIVDDPDASLSGAQASTVTDGSSFLSFSARLPMKHAGTIVAAAALNPDGSVAGPTTSSVGLEVQGTTKALKVSEASRYAIAAPANGMIVSDGGGEFFGYRGGRWRSLEDTEGIRRLLALIYLTLKTQRPLVDQRLLRDELREGIRPYFN